MTFILVDLGSELHDLQLQNRSWRPVAKEIQSRGLVAPDRAEQLTSQLCITVTAEEAHAIAEHLKRALNAGTLSTSISLEVAEAIIGFATQSVGFEVC